MNDGLTAEQEARRRYPDGFRTYVGDWEQLRVTFVAGTEWATKREKARADEAAEALVAERFYVRFDGPPSHDSGRFIEVETESGLSVGPEASGVYWYLQDDGTWLLGPFGYAAPTTEAVTE